MKYKLQLTGILASYGTNITFDKTRNNRYIILPNNFIS